MLVTSPGRVSEPASPKLAMSATPGPAPDGFQLDAVAQLCPELPVQVCVAAGVARAAMMPAVRKADAARNLRPRPSRPWPLIVRFIAPPFACPNLRFRIKK